MALSDAALAALIKTNIEAVISLSDDAQVAKIAEAIAKAVVDHIKASAVVNVTGVSTGLGTASGTVS